MSVSNAETADARSMPERQAYLILQEAGFDQEDIDFLMSRHHGPVAEYVYNKKPLCSCGKNARCIEEIARLRQEAYLAIHPRNPVHKFTTNQIMLMIDSRIEPVLEEAPVSNIFVPAPTMA